MVFIFCALKCEAEMLIRHYELKRIDTRAFAVYTNEEQDLMLVITGTGKIAAANAVGYIAGVYDLDSADCILNFGSAAALERTFLQGASVGTGDLILGNKICDMTAGREFFPDMLIDSGNISEGTICSVDHIITENEGKTWSGDVADMEASAIYQAANSFIGPHQMHFFKIISDNGVEKNCSLKELEQTIKNIILNKEKDICDYVDRVIEYTKTALGRKISLCRKNQELFDKMKDAMKCSVSMERELYQLFVYKETSGGDIRPYFAEYELREALPCRSKREGKVILDEIRRKMLE